MRNPIIGLALSVPVMAVLTLGSTTLANEGDSQQADGQNAQVACTESPTAVVILPEPLNRWAQMRCTSAGYVITGREGWLWIEPNHNALVIIPAFNRQSEADGSAYFTKIEATKVSGEEFDKAYETFHAGFDPKDAKPAGYRLDVSTMDGKDIRLYMFDYFTYGWGMACSQESCDQSSRFVMINMKQDPQPLLPPI